MTNAKNKTNAQPALVNHLGTDRRSSPVRASSNAAADMRKATKPQVTTCEFNGKDGVALTAPFRPGLVPQALRSAQ